LRDAVTKAAESVQPGLAVANPISAGIQISKLRSSGDPIKESMAIVIQRLSSIEAQIGRNDQALHGALVADELSRLRQRRHNYSMLLEINTAVQNENTSLAAGLLAQLGSALVAASARLEPFCRDQLGTIRHSAVQKQGDPSQANDQWKHLIAHIDDLLRNF
jgi:hypothetical protein